LGKLLPASIAGLAVAVGSIASRLTEAPEGRHIGGMRQIDAQSAEAYLRESARIAPAERVRVSELTGGVSNMVLLVERPEKPGRDFVIKQARAQLRTAQPWFSSVERIWREADVMRICGQLLADAARESDEPQAGRTPELLFEDRENYVLAMEAAPRGHEVWKRQLMAGHLDAHVAAACGQLLGTLHGRSWDRADLQQQIGDRTLFDELRVDPYYRRLAVARPETEVYVTEAINALAEHKRSLVLADFSPKNLLVDKPAEPDSGVLLVDFETGHFGDPAFDLGFFLSHLVLKACLAAPRHGPYLALSETFQTAYDRALAAWGDRAARIELWRRGVQNFALCGWARLDGKSPVEYLSDERRRAAMRGLCRAVLEACPGTWAEVMIEADRKFSDL
jgi:5-methylthioribose kinase